MQSDNIKDISIYSKALYVKVIIPSELTFLHTFFSRALPKTFRLKLCTLPITFHLTDCLHLRKFLYYSRLFIVIRNFPTWSFREVYDFWKMVDYI